MKKRALYFCFIGVILVYAQDNKKRQGHINENKFRQLYKEFSTPNAYRSALGAPGHSYYQQEVHYKMDIELNDKDAKLYGRETITYKNNSPDHLGYLWVQLDQNIRKKNPENKLIKPGEIPRATGPDRFTEQLLLKDFDGGFNIEYVRDKRGRPMSYTINQTMMRIELKKPLSPGKKICFDIKWWYNINNHVTNRARSGYEYFAEDDNRVYIIAQFFPRMCVYNDVEGWQNNQFWGRGEFALPFGSYDVKINAPSDHVLDGTGVLLNRKDLFTPDQYKRWKRAQNSFEEPVVIITQEEAEQNEKTKSSDYKTWHFKADSVRDFAFSSSRRFIYDAMAVKVGDRKVMAISMYPKEGNPLWEQYSTKAVATTLLSYSKYTFNYPYHKAISVHSKNQGMEYPMICWNYGRPDKGGFYSDRTKFGMISVIIHEIGHNFFPMIVNSDERQWTWMDEGLNTFMQYLAEQSFQKKYLPELDSYPSRRGPAKNIVEYMSGNQDFITPIMTNSENIFQFGNNAYGKPATALNILREVVMGHDLFDYSFRTYAQQWMFKHPTPEDFFRTMEQASAIDLDWFWRGWFYTTDYVDIGVKSVKSFYLSDKRDDSFDKLLSQKNITLEKPPMVYAIEENLENPEEGFESNEISKNTSALLSKYLKENYGGEKNNRIREGEYFYEITFERPGGIPMPILVKYTYQDGSTKEVKFPSMIWRMGQSEITRAIVSKKRLVKVEIDPKQLTADINTSNNVWPKVNVMSEFEIFKKQFKGSN